VGPTQATRRCQRARLAADGKLVLAGPLDGVNGWRGLFLMVTDDLEEAAAVQCE
jgi:hypothetical protein